ncbi:hypothetical protein WT09_03980 [Burkholderia stagnalis]|nr:hypothetical protein WT09_03980 [Burkholderia stagnalis]KWI41361.1 hypothetical protein WT71_30600 [Burkholderia stagnalis]KWI65673.1 hypothetical protein WT73_19195 [Burkholderia stagnalis]
MDQVGRAFPILEYERAIFRECSLGRCKQCFAEISRYVMDDVGQDHKIELRASLRRHFLNGRLEEGDIFGRPAIKAADPRRNVDGDDFRMRIDSCQALGHCTFSAFNFEDARCVAPPAPDTFGKRIEVDVNRSVRLADATLVGPNSDRMRGPIVITCSP